MKLRTLALGTLWLAAGVGGWFFLTPQLAQHRAADNARLKRSAKDHSPLDTAASNLSATPTAPTAPTSQDPPATIGEHSANDRRMAYSATGTGGGGTGVGSTKRGTVGQIGYGSSSVSPSLSHSAVGQAKPIAPGNIAGGMRPAEAAPTAALGADARHADPLAAAPAEPMEPVLGAPATVEKDFDALFAEVDRALMQLPLGNIAFNTPETIPLGDAATIELLVSLQESEAQLGRILSAAGPVETARVQVSPYMEATLAGTGFRIEAVTPSRQALSGDQRTKWQWQIEPNKAAELELRLTLSAIFKVDGDERTRAIRTFERIITVDVPITHRLAEFVGGNLEWLATLVVIPVFGGLYRRYRRRHENRPSGVAGEMDRAA